MFETTYGEVVKHIGVVVYVGGGSTYKVRFFYANVKKFGTPITIVGSEVELIGHLPKWTELDWDA